MNFKLPLPRAIPGLSWATHKLFFLSWIYTGVGFFAWYKITSAQKQKAEEDHIAYYRYSGHYKHPWEKKDQKYNDPNAIEVTKGKDYVKMVAKPQGNLLY
ncbi:unnamed protein product [Blepharisma stoltei]|uniref:Uncharacterized protein n=1 Tax=Blepharisma stoltei TaxID=1481888 RepID=A0AAU9ITQ0_9CILI|nr:unnamed protein product [Blepharisma stoltei]